MKKIHQMKKETIRIVCVFFTLVALLLLTGCKGSIETFVPNQGDIAEEGVEEPVLPPCRISERPVISASLAKRYTLASAFEDAEVVAHIIVGDWLEEDPELMSTFFEVEIIKTYKGKAEGKIVLKQDGTSKGTLKGYPLLTYGKEVLVFLKDATSLESIHYDNAYWIIGSYTTLLDACYDEKGNVYFNDMGGLLWGSMDKHVFIKEDTREELYKSLIEIDPWIQTIDYRHVNYITEKELLKLWK